jgi:hypothetical protein
MTVKTCQPMSIAVSEWDYWFLYMSGRLTSRLLGSRRPATGDHQMRLNRVGRRAHGEGC